jgi:hypothetical protein
MGMVCRNVSCPQPQPADVHPVVRWITSRRAFNSIYERWCSQNTLVFKEVRH